MTSLEKTFALINSVHFMEYKKIKMQNRKILLKNTSSNSSIILVIVENLSRIKNYTVNMWKNKNHFKKVYIGMHSDL